MELVQIWYTEKAGVRTAASLSVCHKPWYDSWQKKDFLKWPGVVEKSRGEKQRGLCLEFYQPLPSTHTPPFPSQSYALEQVYFEGSERMPKAMLCIPFLGIDWLAELEITSQLGPYSAGRFSRKKLGGVPIFIFVGFGWRIFSRLFGLFLENPFNIPVARGWNH